MLISDFFTVCSVSKCLLIWILTEKIVYFLVERFYHHATDLFVKEISTFMSQQLEPPVHCNVRPQMSRNVPLLIHFS